MDNVENITDSENWTYITNITDSGNLTNSCLVVMDKNRVLNGEIDCANITLPINGYENITDELWKVFIATYEFKKNGLEVPGEKYKVLETNTPVEYFDFIANPSILSLSINKKIEKLGLNSVKLST